ncbi:hypothetical protein BGX34_008797, partial [Mortierella sp. NVP85]
HISRQVPTRQGPQANKEGQELSYRNTSSRGRGAIRNYSSGSSVIRRCFDNTPHPHCRI